MADSHSIDPALIRERFAYNPETGEVSSRKTGRVYRSTIGDGGKIVVVNGKRLYSHRVAFVLMTGSWPRFTVDHINGNRADNRWANLRDVPQQENSQNRVSGKSGSATGLLGVSARKNGLFYAQLKIDGKNKFLGAFKTPEEAHAAYLRAKAVHHPHAWVVLRMNHERSPVLPLKDDSSDRTPQP